MREFWTFVGGVAVGILAVTGVFAMDENESLSSVDYDDEHELEKGADNDDVDDYGAVIAR